MTNYTKYNMREDKGYIIWQITDNIEYNTK